MSLAQESISAEVADEVHKGFNASETIMEHVSNSGHENPLIRFPKLFGIDFSVTKHVLMIWLVAAFVFVVITWTVRRYLKQDRLIPTGLMNALESVVEYIRESIILPNVGAKWANTWAPLILTFFFFILCANAIGLIPLFDMIALFDRIVIHSTEHSFLYKVIHGGTTATANYNVTAALASVTFLAIIIAGSKAHGFVKHWKNLVPSGLNPILSVALIPIELMGMIVKPFALTMRLAANMMGGHIAILAILSFIFLFTESFHSLAVGVGVGLFVSVPLAALVSTLEIIVVLVQAYVFTLLTAVFIGMAINVHH